MGTRLNGKVAVVTGSTSGIGAGIAEALAAAGARVVLTGRRQERGEQVVEALRARGREAVFEPADLSRPEDCRRICQHAAEAFGGLDVLVNNLGIFPREGLEETTPEFWDEMFDLNVRSVFLCCQSALPLLRQRGGGSIINIGSCAAFSRGGGRLFAYSCSKGALYVLTMKLAADLAPDHIRVNWITVGWVLTEKEYEVQAREGRSPESLHEQAARLPMGQYNTVEDIAAGCVYLASDDAVRVTGSNLNISAGLWINI